MKKHYKRSTQRTLGKPKSEIRSITGESLWWGNPTTAGQYVSHDTALGLTAYFCAIKTIATDTAGLPLGIFGRDSNGDRQPLPDHPATKLLTISPDGETDPMRFRQAMMGHVLGHGNAYVEIVRNGDGSAAKLHLLDPISVYAKRLPTGDLIYVLPDNKYLEPENCIHIAGFGYDGLNGYSPIQLFKNSIGLAQAAETFGAAFFQNASRPAGYLKMPTHLKDEAAVKRLRESWDLMQGGSNNAGRTAILENGVEFVPISIKPEDAQFLMTRQFQVIEVARMFNLPPHKLMNYENAHYNNIESANLDYLQTSLLPWLRAIEQAFNRKLFKPSEVGSLYIEHNMDGFLRGSISDRTSAYERLFNIGALSRNEIRRMENRPSIGPEGDKFFVTKQVENSTNDQTGS